MPVDPATAYRRHRLFKGAAVILTALGVPLFFVSLQFMPLPWVLLTLIPVLLAAHIALAVANHRAVKSLHATNFQICPACNYDLRASPARGPCPECGTPYSTSSLLRIWRDRLDSPC